MALKITRAVITAAGRNRRALPLQMLIDRDGIQKSVLSIILNEAWQAGIEQCCVVICPGDETAYRDAAGDHVERLHFVTQPEPLGYGHAVYCARAFVDNQPFLHMMSDHIYLSANSNLHPSANSNETGCARQLVEMAETQACAVSGVQSTRENLLPHFGTIGGQRVKGTQDLFQIDQVIEKPTPTLAEQTLFVPGLRMGHYLCFSGMHVLTPRVMTLLEKHIANTTQNNTESKIKADPGNSARNGGGGLIALSPVLNELAQEERYLALETRGQRYHLDARYGLLMAQLALTLAGQDREEVLAGLCELLAQRQSGKESGQPL